MLAGKDGAREGKLVSAGPEDAAAAGFEAGLPGERLHRAVWHLIASGELEGALEPGSPTNDDLEPGPSTGSPGPDRRRLETGSKSPKDCYFPSPNFADRGFCEVRKKSCNKSCT